MARQLLPLCLLEDMPSYQLLCTQPACICDGSALGSLSGGTC